MPGSACSFSARDGASGRARRIVLPASADPAAAGHGPAHRDPDVLAGGHHACAAAAAAAAAAPAPSPQRSACRRLSCGRRGEWSPHRPACPAPPKRRLLRCLCSSHPAPPKRRSLPALFPPLMPPLRGSRRQGRGAPLSSRAGAGGGSPWAGRQNPSGPPQARPGAGFDPSNPPAKTPSRTAAGGKNLRILAPWGQKIPHCRVKWPMWCPRGRHGRFVHHCFILLFGRGSKK